MTWSSRSGPWFHFTPHPVPGTRPNHLPLLEHTKKAFTLPLLICHSLYLEGQSLLHELILLAPPVSLLHYPHHPSNDLLNILLETVHVCLVTALFSKLSTQGWSKVEAQ